MSSSLKCHSESVLQTLLVSQDEEERRFAVLKILDLRKGNPLGNTEVRARRTPEINKNATSLVNLIDWDVGSIHEPVLTCHMSRHELIDLLDHPMKVPYMPVHGQAIERVVKQVTKAAGEVFGEEKRDGFIRAAAAQRALVPKRNSKQDLINLAM